MSRTRVIAWPNTPLAASLARELECACSELALHRFPDGETLARIAADVDGHDVVLVARLDRPEGKFLPLAFACDAARELGARRVVLVAPYLPYMRQDTRFHPGEAVSSRTFARLVSSTADALVTIDPHLHRWRDLSQLYSIPTRVAHAAPAIAQWVARNVPSPLIVGPDGESEQWAAEIARLAQAPYTVLEKTRRGDRDVAVRIAGGLPAGRFTPVIVDDIVSTGRTLVAAAAALRAAGLPAPVAVAVHALLDDASLAAIGTAGIQTLVTCDTVEHATNAISVLPALAQALQRA